MDNLLKRLPGALMFAAVAMLLVWCAQVTYQNNGELKPLDSIHRATVAMADRFAKPEPDGWAQERIINLPEDGQQFYLTVFVHDDWYARPQDRELLRWFTTHPGLEGLRAQCHYLEHSPSDPMFQARWAPRGWTNTLPAVMLQQGNPHPGKAVYKVGPKYMPATADALAQQIDVSLQTLRDLCPPPKPPVKPPFTPPVVQPIPNVIPPETAPPPANKASDVLTVILIVIAGALGLAWGFGEEMWEHFTNALKGQDRER